MNAYLLTWNPKYYTPTREMARMEKYGDCFSHWHTNCRQMEPGDDLFLMRQGKEPRGIVATGHTRKDRHFVHHNGRWFVSVRWTWFQPEEPIFTLDDLRTLFPDQHWTPRGSGIQITPPTDNEFIELIRKAKSERETEGEYVTG
jgi:hypothetical protein